MNYEVWLGNTALYGVESVEESAERKISIYDAVGAGKFPQAESRGLKEWEIQCELTEYNDRNLRNWSAASDVFGDFERLLKKKEPARLVIRSDYAKTSKRVLFKGFSKQEAVSGVYTVKLSCVEHVVAAVKTTDLPYVARPGKVPPLPPVVVVTNENQSTMGTILNGIAYPSANAEDYDKLITWLDPETRKRINPVTLKPGDRVYVDSDPNAVFFTEQQREDAWVNKSRDAITRALDPSEPSLPSWGPE